MLRGMLIISLIVLLSICGFILFFKISSGHYDNKYEKTTLGSSLKIIEEDWGKPDNLLVQDTLLILSYNDRVMTDYVFKFNKRTKRLVEKWTGD